MPKKTDKAKRENNKYFSLTERIAGNCLHCGHLGHLFFLNLSLIRLKKLKNTIKSYNLNIVLNKFFRGLIIL